MLSRQHSDDVILQDVVNGLNKRYKSTFKESDKK